MMKKTTLILTIFIALSLSAKTVDPNDALQVAQNYINAPQADNAQLIKKSRPQKRLARVTKLATSDQQFYIYQNPDGEGFVIVSADDVARPILGYSHTGHLDVDNMPDNMRWWLSEYDRQIRWAKENNIPQSSEIAQEWELLRANKATAATPVIEPLLKTYWNQSPYYNEKCPSSNNDTALTGCVATAMAQVMRYWSWPEKGFGSHEYTPDGYSKQSVNFGATTYDWDNMPAWLDGNSSAKEVNAVATLMYHCGVSVDMNYGTNMSGAVVADVPRSACNYFYYSNKIKYVECDAYSVGNWLRIISKQLNEHKPVVYGGQSYNGKSVHAFVCDGYDSDYNLHFNWGWGNQYSEASYHPIILINAPDGQEFSYFQRAVINMFPQAPKHETEITLRAKIPSDWTGPISAWVWGDGITAAWHKLTVKDGYVEYKTTQDILNMVIVNGTDWGSLEDQTIDISTDRSACIVIDKDLDSQNENKRTFHYTQCAHDITLDVNPPSDWKNALSAWVWTTDQDGQDQDGHWVTLNKANNRYQLTVHAEQLNAVIVNGNAWNGDNNQTQNIEITENTCIYIGNETSGKRSYTFGDCERPITVKAKMPADWGSTISAFVWDLGGGPGQWITPKKNGDWYSFTRTCSRLNIIFVNGTDWNGDTNQTMDISTAYDACYYIGSNAGKRTVIQTDCADIHDVPQILENLVITTSSVEKVLRDGHLYILRDGKTYNAQGARVE